MYYYIIYIIEETLMYLRYFQRVCLHGMFRSQHLHSPSNQSPNFNPNPSHHLQIETRLCQHLAIQQPSLGQSWRSNRPLILCDPRCQETLYKISPLTRKIELIHSRVANIVCITYHYTL